MKRKINIFWLVYLIIVFLPIGAVVTIVATVLTIIFAFIGDYRWCYMPAKIWAKALCCLSFVRIEVKGRENYSPQKSYIFVANHSSIYDVFVIYGWLDSRFKWIMKSTLRQIPFVGLACEKAGHIFIDRSNPIKAQRSLRDAEDKLKNGASVVIFPEGHRSNDGNVGKFKKGAFKLAEDLKLPIVPITIEGAYEVMPISSYYIKPHKITMTIHQVIDCKHINNNNIGEYIEKTRNVIIG